jgi:hypothetical protein
MRRRTREAPPAPDSEIQQAVRDLGDAETAVRRLRTGLYAQIYDYWQTYGDRRGWQTELVKTTGLTRERIRQILDAEDARREAQQSPRTAE